MNEITTFEESTTEEITTEEITTEASALDDFSAFDKPFDEYSLTEIFLFILVVVTLISCVFALFRKGRF